MRIWTRAAAAAAQTPAGRNRYVDFLRAVSILVVIAGHWTAAAPHVGKDGTLVASHMLDVSPWTQGLTWIIQVMPIFFLVGGFANGVSWRAARKAGTSYAAWLEARLRRLVGPVLVLIATWAAIGTVASLAGVPAVMIERGSQMALIPIWFLAVYVVVVVLAPVTHAAWERWGWISFLFLAAAAVAMDVAFFLGGWRWMGWLNYLFVWSSVHQLGYGWRDGHLDRPGRTLAMAAVGLGALIGLVAWGPYPLSMVGVPGDAISNTTPPKITILALGLAQGGLLLSVQGPLRRWLARPVPWTATIVVSGMIMTIYLWHLTSMTLLVGLFHMLGDVGLGVQPGTGLWWSTRPLWLAVLTLGLVPLGLVFSRFERVGVPGRGAAPPAPLLVAGAALVCAGLALLALDGIGGSGWLGIRWWVIALPFAGAMLLHRWR